jgi:hypothetical protein
MAETQQGDWVKSVGLALLMESGIYKGYRIFGHAILQQDRILLPERYAASGTITRETKIVEASGVLGVFDRKKRLSLQD